MVSEKNGNGKITEGEAYATTAAVLLKEWLSISESQICSAEVLSEHLPAVNNLLETSMNSISTHFGNIARASNEIDTKIKNVSSEIDIISIKGKQINITEYIKSIADGTADTDTAKKLEELLTAVQIHENNIAKELKEAQIIIEKSASEISKIVVDMQFQDRVSQNIMITINILKTISDFLEKEITNSLPNVSKVERKKLLNKEFAGKLLQTFRLGELQHSYVNHLINHGYINDASEVGFSPKDHNKKDGNDDVELF